MATTTTAIVTSVSCNGLSSRRMKNSEAVRLTSQNASVAEVPPNGMSTAVARPCASTQPSGSAHWSLETGPVGPLLKSGSF